MTSCAARKILSVLDALTLAMPDSFIWTNELRRQDYAYAISTLRMQTTSWRGCASIRRYVRRLPPISVFPQSRMTSRLNTRSDRCFFDA